jgi:8-oxo-dGTP pyrophosphatase MutT (NUDIX family)
MSAVVRNHRDFDLTAVPSARFVRLSQLRKLRECEQVAAVCYRERSGNIEFLLIQTRGSGRWTFPKGSPEPGLTHAQAAALEAFEEAGVHGRIEEASFTRYCRKRDGEQKTAAGLAGKELVNAHLCEVLRLGTPKESKRNRTWFSVQEAKRRLRERREHHDGAEFARVVDRAVERIQRLRGRTGIVNDRKLFDRPFQKDALQSVQFEAFSEAYGRAEEAPFKPYVRRQLAAMRQAAVSVADGPGEVLPCEVLQFGPPRGKKVKALGTGTSLRN